MGFPLTPVNGQTAIVNGIKYIYISVYKSWRRDFNNVLDRLYLIGGNETVSSSTGDLVVLGGGYFGKSVIIGKDLTVYGTATFYGPIIGSVSSTTNITGGAPGSLLYQVNTSTTGFIGIGPAGSQLISDGTVAYWTITQGGYANTATNIEGGDTWQVPFQASTSTTIFSPDFTYDNNLGSLIIKDLTSSVGTDTGAIITYGGLGVGENLNVGGNLTVGGDFTVNGSLTYLNTTNLDITDKLITLAKGSTTTAISVGAGFEIEGTAANITYANNEERFVSSVKIEVPSLVATAGIPATDSNTGTIQVTGGVGVTGNVVAGLFVGSIGDDLLGRNTSKFTTVDANGQITAGSSAQAIFWNTTTQLLSTTASVYVVGGLAVEGNAIIKGLVETPGGIQIHSSGTSGLHLLSRSSNPENSPKLKLEARNQGYVELYSSSAGGALIIDYLGTNYLSLDNNQLVYYGTTPATSTVDGSITTYGGISAADNVFIGGHYNGIKLDTGSIRPYTTQNLTINTTGSGILTLQTTSIFIDATSSASISTSTFIQGAVEAVRFNEIEISNNLSPLTKITPTPTDNNLFLVGNGAGTVFIGTASIVTNIVGGLSINEDLSVVGYASANRYNDLIIDNSTVTNLTISAYNANQGLNFTASGSGNIGFNSTRVEITATTVVNGAVTANSFNDIEIARSINSATVTLSSLLQNQSIEIAPNGTGTTIVSSKLIANDIIQANDFIRKSVLELSQLQVSNNITLAINDITANIITSEPMMSNSDIYLPPAGPDLAGYDLVIRNRSTLYTINVNDTSTSFVAFINTSSNIRVISDGLTWFIQ